MPIFGLLVLCAILVVLCATAWFGLRAARRIPEPVCANCRYPTADITRLICPECGNDLRAVGILTPRIRARMAGAFFGVVVGWTLVMALIMLLATNIVAGLGPQVFVVNSEAQFRQSAWPAPSPGYEIAIDETFEMDAAAWANAPMTINGASSMNADTRTSGVIRVMPQGAGPQISARVRSSGIDFGAGTVPFTQIDAAVVTPWLAGARIVNPDAAEVDAIALALRNAEEDSIVDTLHTSPVFVQSSSGQFGNSYSQWGKGGAIAIGIVSFVLWILGILRLASLMRLPAPAIANPT